jgi:GntR family transcriptional regulator, transcriptional repressor for pyruvate dehydrogenase complex
MPQSKFEELTPVRFSEQIADRIEATIIDREFRPGDKLPPERILADSFGVSRSVVREALKLLAQRGLVQSRMGDGTYVVDPGMSAVISSITVASRMQNTTIDDLTEVRLHLEVPIAGLAAFRATAADIAKIEAAVYAMDASVPQLDDPDKRMELVRADLDFHTALAAATHNPVFVILSNSIFDILLDERAKSQSKSPAVTEPGHRYHRVILECVKNRDAAGAREAMREHLQLHAVVKSQKMPDDPTVSEIRS